MWRLKRLGDVAVFRKPQPRSGIDISVQILLDTSGSMAGSLQCASDVTIALAEAMARTSGAKCSLAVFPAAGAYSQTILPFGGQISKARRTMQTIRAFGGTPLGGAMADVIPYLERQRTMRKLLLVITDGSPRDSSEVFSQMKLAQERDIEVIGIGIGEQLEGRLKTFIPRSAVVKTVHDLAPALEQVFRNDRL
jgi:Mg-chelatase subunit ChlD